MNNDPNKPIFIVFEGLDGSGKSTLARLVAETLGAVLLTTPSPSVRKYRDELITSFDGNQEAAQLFYLSTVFDASQRVAEMLAVGQSVVIDRYFLSTQAYAAFRGSRTRIDALGELLQPADVTVYLDVPLDVRRARLARRGTSAADLETLSDEAQRELRKQHIGRSALTVVGHLLHINDADSTAEELAARVIREAKSHRAA